MEAVVLILTVYCGTPVSAFLTYPKDGDRVTILDPVGPENRLFWADLTKQVEASPAGRVHRIKVEAQVEGVRCPVST